MQRVTFPRACGYLRPRNAGDTATLPDREAQNAILLGLAVPALDPVPAAAAEPRPEPAAAPAVEPVPVPAAQEAALSCPHGCKPKVFPHAVAYEAHMRLKHGVIVHSQPQPTL